MARRRRSSSFGALPLIGVLTAPKLAALAVGAFVYLRGRASKPPIDVEGKPSSSMLPASSAPSLVPAASDYAAPYADPYAPDPYYEAPVSDYTPPSPFVDTYQPPPPAPTDSGYTAPSTFVSRGGTTLRTQTAPTTTTTTTTTTSSPLSVYDGSAFRTSSGGTIGTKSGSSGYTEDSGRAIRGLRGFGLIRPRN